MLADFQHAARHWMDGEKLSKFKQIEALTKMFPIDEETLGPDGKTKVKKSSNNVTVRELIREHSKEGKDLNYPPSIVQVTCLASNLTFGNFPNGMAAYFCWC
jgi:hypothetical protein